VFIFDRGDEAELISCRNANFFGSGNQHDTFLKQCNVFWQHINE